MKHEELWLVFTTKNPKLSGDDDMTVTLTVRGLKKLFDTAWEQGRQNGFENGMAYEANQAKMKTQANKVSNFGNIFGEIFGGKES